MIRARRQTLSPDISYPFLSIHDMNDAASQQYGRGGRGDRMTQFK